MEGIRVGRHTLHVANHVEEERRHDTDHAQILHPDMVEKTAAVWEHHPIMHHATHTSAYQVSIFIEHAKMETSTSVAPAVQG